MRNLRILVSTLIVGVLFVGCTQEMKKSESISEKKIVTEGTSSSKEDLNTTESKLDYDYVGEIIEFNGDIVTILSGDIAEDFKIDKSTLDNFYLGQQVTIKDKKLAPFIPQDPKSYDIKHTTMGEIILSVKGEIKSISADSFVLSIDGKDISFDSYLSDDDEKRLENGMRVTVDYLERAGSQFALDIYDESSTMDLEILSLSRDDSGNMIISAQSQTEEKFDIIVSGSTDLNFNHSELKPGNSIKVYPTKMTKSIPAQVSTNKIVLLR